MTHCVRVACCEEVTSRSELEFGKAYREQPEHETESSPSWTKSFGSSVLCTKRRDTFEGKPPAWVKSYLSSINAGPSSQITYNRVKYPSSILRYGRNSPICRIQTAGIYKEGVSNESFLLRNDRKIVFISSTTPKRINEMSLSRRNFQRHLH